VLRSCGRCVCFIHKVLSAWDGSMLPALFCTHVTTRRSALHYLHICMYVCAHFAVCTPLICTY
jgi:hypothetical protein